jgi:transposase
MKIIHWIGIDDHADKWTIAQYKGNEEKPAKEFELVPDAGGYRKLIAFAKGLDGEVRIVYEAGPCGYELYRRLTKAGLQCQVAAPSLTPRKPGERVKTNRRDAAKLGRYLRSNELTMITVPDADRESLRDLIRARQAVQKDLVSIRHQIVKFLLRYGHRYRDGKAWTARFWVWIGKLTLEGEYGQVVLDEMISTHVQRVARLGRYDDAIEAAAKRPGIRAVHRGAVGAPRDPDALGDDDSLGARRPEAVRHRATADGRRRSRARGIEYGRQGHSILDHQDRQRPRAAHRCRGGLAISASNQ